MKKLIGIFVVLLFVLAMSGVANALPHGGYNTGSDACDDCHEIHGALADKLLKFADITDTCSMGGVCHAPSGGATNVYDVPSPAAKHNPTAGITTLPSGSGDDMAKALICTSCHSVHGTLAVNSFTSDSTETPTGTKALHKAGNYGSDARYLPGAGNTASDNYDSVWCADCHNLRHTGASNHPVATTSGATYGDVVPTVGGSQSLGGSNQRYTMTPSFNTKYGGATTDVPYSVQNLICQQCHEDSRNVTGAYAAGTNPAYIDFPHSTQNDSFVIEGLTDGSHLDDLCLNCHDTDILP